MANKKRVSKKDGKNANKPLAFDTCYVCERYVGASGERDHFPVSHAEGGECILPICMPCHDLKDRIPLENWDGEIAFSGLMELWAKASLEERLWIIKLFHICGMQNALIADLMQENSAEIEEPADIKQEYLGEETCYMNQQTNEK